MEEIDEQLGAIVRSRVGTTLCAGKYRLDGVLGIGGMAAVYAGTHRNGRPVAIKLLHPELSRRPEIRKRFLREGQAANAVQHRGVVAVIDDDVTEDGAAFVVMERLEGQTLEEIWERLGRRLPVRAVLAIARELCGILAVAHRAGIIHRDLKPENLFLTNDAELKVLDFGLAQLRDAARPKETQTGMIFGTPAFMPPEQASGQTSKVDARSDLWAVGATMFTLLSGKLVHDGETARHFVMLAAMEPARSLEVAMPDAHPALVSLVDRALARDKEQRWQSAESMRESIVSLSERLFGEPETPLMNPLALTAGAPPLGAEALPKLPGSSEESTFDPTKLALVANLTEADESTGDQTTIGSGARSAVAAIPDSGGGLDDGTRVGVPDFTEVGNLTAAPATPQRTLPSAQAHSTLPRLDEGSTDSLVDSSDLPIPFERPSWNDPLAEKKSIEAPVRTPSAPEPTFDQAQRESEGRMARPATPYLAMRPVARSRPSSTPQPQGLPALIGMLRSPESRAAGIPFLPVVVAAILLAAVLAYALAQGCRGDAARESEKPTITAPDTPSPSTSQIPPENAPTPKVVSTSSAAAPPPVAPHSAHDTPPKQKR